MTSDSLRITDRYTATTSRLTSLLDEIETAGCCRRTVCLTPGSMASEGVLSGLTPLERQMAAQLGRPDTGACLFAYDDGGVAVVPPLPIEKGSTAEGMDPSALEEVLTRRPTIGVVLLRLGRYSVGVVRGDEVLASKSGTRHVKSRHRAGGSSANRFARSRERLIRELYDKTCQVATDVLGPIEKRLDYLMLGGETHTLNGFIKQCDLVQRLGSITLARRLNVERPGKKAFDKVSNEIWKSSVVLFAEE